jgi:hypothetical protein
VPTTHVGVERQVATEDDVGMTGNTVTQRIEWGTGQIPPGYVFGRATGNTVSW